MNNPAIQNLFAAMPDPPESMIRFMETEARSQQSSTMAEANSSNAETKTKAKTKTKSANASSNMAQYRAATESTKLIPRSKTVPQTTKQTPLGLLDWPRVLEGLEDRFRDQNPVDTYPTSVAIERHFQKYRHKDRNLNYLTYHDSQGQFYAHEFVNPNQPSGLEVPELEEPDAPEENDEPEVEIPKTQEEPPSPNDGT